MRDYDIKLANLVSNVIGTVNQDVRVKDWSNIISQKFSHVDVDRDREFIIALFEAMKDTNEHQ